MSVEKEQELKEFIGEILGFSKPWEVTKISKKLEKEKVEIYLSYPKGTRFKCPECGKECSVHESKYRELRHLDLWQYKTIIKVKVPRIKCCGGKKRDITPVC